MMFNVILLTKLLIIVVCLIILPTKYLFLRSYWFTSTMPSLLKCRVVNFYILFYIYKIWFIFFILYILLFLTFVELFVLVALINLGVVY